MSVICTQRCWPGFIYDNTKLEKAGAYMDSLCLGIGAVEDFVSKGWRGGAANTTCLTWVGFLGRSLCWTGGGESAGGRAPGFPEASGFQQPLCMGPTASGTTCRGPFPLLWEHGSQKPSLTLL